MDESKSAVLLDLPGFQDIVDFEFAIWWDPVFRWRRVTGELTVAAAEAPRGVVSLSAMVDELIAKVLLK